jgi:hypothetical protein
MFASSSCVDSSHNDDSNSNIISQVKVESILSGFIELNSHADTSCIGRGFHIISYTDEVCNITPYHPKYKTMGNVLVVQAGAAFGHPDTGTTYILVNNQGLYFGDALPQILLNPNQVQANGIAVDEVFHQFGGTHSIALPQMNLHLPLQVKGVLSCLPI